MAGQDHDRWRYYEIIASNKLLLAKYLIICMNDDPLNYLNDHETDHIFSLFTVIELKLCSMKV